MSQQYTDTFDFEVLSAFQQIIALKESPDFKKGKIGFSNLKQKADKTTFITSTKNKPQHVDDTQHIEANTLYYCSSKNKGRGIATHLRHAFAHNQVKKDPVTSEYEIVSYKYLNRKKSDTVMLRARLDSDILVDLIHAILDIYNSTNSKKNKPNEADNTKTMDDSK